MEHLYICDTFVEYLKIRKKNNKIKVVQKAKIEMDRGIITNGFIINSTAFIEVLKKLEIKTKHLKVLIDTNGVVFKKIEVPKDIGKNNLDKFVNLGFKDIEEKEKIYLYSYKDIKEKNSRYLLSMNVEEEKIENYINVFNLLQWKVDSIESANTTIYNILRNQTQYNKPFSLIYLCNDILNIFFYEAKNNILNFRTRIIDENIDGQVYENIINTFRFSKVSLDGSSEIYSIGIKNEIREQLKEINLEIIPVEIKENENWEFPYVYFNAFSKDKDRFNLLESFEEKNKKKLSKSFKIFIGCSGLILCSLLGVSGIIKYQEAEFYRENLNLEQKIGSIKDSSLYSDYLEATAEKFLLESNIENINEIYNFVTDNTASLNSQQMNVLNNLVESEKLNGIYIYEYNYIRENNILNISGVSDNSSGSLNFAKKIRALNIFDDIDYNLKELDYEKGYAFSIDCVVMEIKEEEVIIDGIDE